LPKKQKQGNVKMFEEIGMFNQTETLYNLYIHQTITGCPTNMCDIYVAFKFFF
jgi:hypothetical protein